MTGTTHGLRQIVIRTVPKMAVRGCVEPCRVTCQCGERQSISEIQYDSLGSDKGSNTKGTNTRSNLYWGRGWYVWNNTGDKAILRSSRGTLKDTCEWGDGKGYKNC
jgi:hypothetical protein